MSKKEPERTCVACRKKSTKENFIKVVLNKNGEIAVEHEKKLDGRGAYICKNEACVQKCKKSKSLNKVFKKNLPENIYEDLESELKS